MHARGNRSPGAASPLLMKTHSKTTFSLSLFFLSLSLTHSLTSLPLRRVLRRVSARRPSQRRVPLLFRGSLVTPCCRSFPGACRTRAARRERSRRPIATPSSPARSASVVQWHAHPRGRGQRVTTCTRPSRSLGSSSAYGHSLSLSPLSRQSTREHEHKRVLGARRASARIARRRARTAKGSTRSARIREAR